MSEEHVHAWRMTAHLDFCHSYTSTFECAGKGPPKKCGATAAISHERNLKSISGAMFFDPDCERCQELQDGAPVRYDRVVCDKDGNVIVEEHIETEQTADDEEGTA